MANGLLSSLSGLFGGSGPQVPEQYLQNQAADKYVQGQAGLSDPSFQRDLGVVSQNGDIGSLMHNWGNDQSKANSIASDPRTGSMFAQSQLNQNQPYQQTMDQGESLYNTLNGQIKNGFSLTPQDQSLYGQASNNIARQFGQQGNAASANLAMRGLSNSGAAGATFSGLQGNQNEQLAQAQTQIMQQRYQNTMQQIQQAQNINQSMGNYSQGALQNQYNRNLAGTQNGQQAGMNAAGLTNQQNQNGMQAYGMDQANKPGNLVDMGMGAAMGALGAGAGAAGKAFGNSLFAPSKKPADDGTSGIVAGSSLSY